MGITRYLLILIIPPLIILSNFRYLLTDYSFYREIQAKSGVALNESTERSTKNIINYLSGKGNLNQEFSTQAKLHMGDVKKLITTTSVHLYFLIICILIIGVIQVARKKTKSLAKFIALGSLICAFIIVLLSLGASKYFDNLFLKFHLFSFPNNLWLFGPDDLLIQIFPQQFFFLFTRVLAKNTIYTSILIFILALAISKVSREK